MDWAVSKVNVALFGEGRNLILEFTGFVNGKEVEDIVTSVRRPLTIGNVQSVKFAGPSLR